MPNSYNRNNAARLNIPLEPSIDLGSLTHFVREQILPRQQTPVVGGEFSMELLKKLHQLGWLQSYVPKEYGGIGLSTSDLLFISREIAYGSAGVFSTFHSNMVGHLAIILYAKEALRRRLSQAYVDTFSLWSFCVTEPNSGSDVLNLQTNARRVPGGYRLSGHKAFISNANYSDHLFVLARLSSGSEKRAHLTGFYLPANSPGVTRGTAYVKMGQADSNTSELFFEDVFIPDEHLVGDEGGGLKILQHCIQRSKTLIAGAGVGISQRAGDLVRLELGQRIRFGKPLLSQPTINSFLAQLYTEVQASWLLASHAAVVWDSGSFAIQEASMAKLFSANTAVRFVNEAVELFGAYGYMQEFEIERLYRDVKLLEIYEGASNIQRILIAKELFPEVMNRRAVDEGRRAA